MTRFTSSLRLVVGIAIRRRNRGRNPIAFPSDKSCLTPYSLMFSRIFSLSVFCTLASFLAPLATAGLLTVETDMGGKATVDILYIIQSGQKEASEASYSVKDGSGLDKSKNSGEITVEIPDQDKVEAVAVRSKVTDPAAIGGERKTVARMGYKGKSGTNLQSFEPLDVDLFLPSDEDVILLADYDIPLFLRNGIAFSKGQEFTSMNGLIASLSGLVFRDASSLFTSSDDFFFDLSIGVKSPQWDSLPLYDGQVTVASHLEFRRIPEPSTWALTIGMLMFLIWRHSGSRFPIGFGYSTPLIEVARAARRAQAHDRN